MTVNGVELLLPTYSRVLNNSGRGNRLNAEGFIEIDAELIKV